MSHAKLTTLMVLMIALITGSALAGDIDFYGKLHMSVDMNNDGDDSGMFLGSNTSRFGWKSSMEMNEDFTFVWQVESFIDPAGKGGTLSNRNSFLGVSHEYGTVLFGIHDTPFKMLGRKVELFHDQMGDFRHLSQGWDRRLSDVVAYVSPDMSGFSFVGAYQMPQAEVGAQDDKGALSIAGFYKKTELMNEDDYLFLGAGYEMVMKGYFLDPMADPTYTQVYDPIGDTWSTVTTPDTDYNDDPQDAIGMRFGMQYGAKKFKVSGMFQSLTNGGGAQYMDGDGNMADLTSTLMGGGAAVNPAGKYWLKTQIYMLDPNTDTDDDESTLMAFGVDYVWCKSLTFYGQYAMVSNGDNAQAGLEGSFHGSHVGAFAPGETASSVSFGMFKKF